MNYVIIAAAAFLSVLLWGTFSGEQKLVFEKTPPVEQSDNADKPRWETKTDERPPVAIAVTPIELGGEAGEWKFKIILDTHTGSLDDDLIRQATLSDGQRKVRRPVRWEGPGPGGHHREGALVFEAAGPGPSAIELVLRDVGGIAERTFTWAVE